VRVCKNQSITTRARVHIYSYTHSRTHTYTRAYALSLSLSHTHTRSYTHTAAVAASEARIDDNTAAVKEKYRTMMDRVVDTSMQAQAHARTAQMDKDQVCESVFRVVYSV
jgi:hypothetical protein